MSTPPGLPDDPELLRAMVLQLSNLLKSNGIEPVTEQLSLEEVKAHLQEAMVRLAGGDESAQAEFDKWDGILASHPEHVEELRLKEEKWEENNRELNKVAFDKTLSFVPEDIFATYDSLKETCKGLPRLVQRVRQTRTLWLLRMNPNDIKKIHQADLKIKYATQGLDLTELRAVYHHVPKEFENDGDGSKKKWQENIRSKLKEQVAKHTRGDLRGSNLRNSAYGENVPQRRNTVASFSCRAGGGGSRKAPPSLLAALNKRHQGHEQKVGKAPPGLLAALQKRHNGGAPEPKARKVKVPKGIAAALGSRKPPPGLLEALSKKNAVLTGSKVVNADNYQAAGATKTKTPDRGDYVTTSLKTRRMTAPIISSMAEKDTMPKRNTGAAPRKRRQSAAFLAKLNALDKGISLSTPDSSPHLSFQESTKYKNVPGTRTPARSTIILASKKAPQRTPQNGEIESLKAIINALKQQLEQQETKSEKAAAKLSPAPGKHSIPAKEKGDKQKIEVAPGPDKSAEYTYFGLNKSKWGVVLSIVLLFLCLCLWLAMSPKRGTVPLNIPTPVGVQKHRSWSARRAMMAKQRARRANQTKLVKNHSFYRVQMETTPRAAACFSSNMIVLSTFFSDPFFSPMSNMFLVLEIRNSKRMSTKVFHFQVHFGCTFRTPELRRFYNMDSIYNATWSDPSSRVALVCLGKRGAGTALMLHGLEPIFHSRLDGASQSIPRTEDFVIKLSLKHKTTSLATRQVNICVGPPTTTEGKPFHVEAYDMKATATTFLGNIVTYEGQKQDKASGLDDDDETIDKQVDPASDGKSTKNIILPQEMVMDSKRQSEV